jgi:hypothetical protein
MSKRTVVVEVSFDVDDFLAGMAWCVGTVPSSQVDEQVRSFVARQVESGRVFLNASKPWCELDGVAVARTAQAPAAAVSGTGESAGT